MGVYPSAVWIMVAAFFHLEISRADTSVSVDLVAARAGDVGAAYEVGRMYFTGEGLPKNMSEALSWLGRAAEQGHIEAQYLLGYIYDRALGVPRDDVAAYKWLNVAAAHGHRRAARLREEVAGYLRPEELKEAQAQALTLSHALEKREAAAEGARLQDLLARGAAGDIDIQFQIAEMYEEGDGVPKNLAEALNWYRKAAAQGHREAQFRLARMYEQGLGTPRNSVEAYVWYDRAAEHGHPVAGRARNQLADGMTSEQKDLAKRLVEEQRTPSEKLPITQRALPAEESVSKVQLRPDSTAPIGDEIFTPIEDGPAEGITQSEASGRLQRGTSAYYIKYADQYRKAADRGHPWAQYVLGMMCQEGWGTAKDPAQAVKWYHRAATQGSPSGQWLTGLAYQDGTGVSADPIEAYKWYLIAAHNGSKQGEKFSKNLEPQLKPEQLAEAQKRVSAFVPVRER